MGTWPYLFRLSDGKTLHAVYFTFGGRRRRRFFSNLSLKTANFNDFLCAQTAAPTSPVSPDTHILYRESSPTSRCLSHSVKSHARSASRRECTRTEARARHQSVHTHRPREAAAGSRAAQPGGSVRLGGAGGCGARRHGAATARALSPVSTAPPSHETKGTSRAREGYGDSSHVRRRQEGFHTNSARSARKN